MNRNFGKLGWIFLILLNTPFLWLVLYSFEVRFSPPYLTLVHWQTAWRLLDLPLYFRNSFLITAGGIFLSLTLSSLAGYALASSKSFPGKAFAWAMVLAAFFIPNFFSIFVNLWTMAQFLPRLGIRLVDTHLGVILPFAVNGFGIIFMRQAFAAVPNELRDAARVDGANEWFIYFRIMLPLTGSQLAALAVKDGIVLWDLFLWPLIVLKTKAKYPLALAIQHLAGLFLHNPRVVAAAAVMMTLPLILLFVIAQKWFVEGILSGAVKK